MAGVADELARLQRLHRDGFLSDDEYESQRSVVLEFGAKGELAEEDCYGAELCKLAELVQSGVLTRSEFETQKAALIWAPEEPTPSIGVHEWPAPSLPEVDRPPVPTGWEWVLVVAGLMAAAGSLLPWEQANVGIASLTRNGFQLGNNLSFSSDGLVVLLLGAIGALIGITRLAGRPFPRWINDSPILVGLIIALYGINDELNMSQTVANLRKQDPVGLFTVGYGLWLVIVGGALFLLAGAGGWWLHRHGRYAERGM